MIARHAIALLVRVLALLACASGLSCADTDPPLNAVIVTIDTLRADQLGAYGGSAKTPHLDRLAAAGRVFERATAPIPVTRPAHFSIFTSLYPREHGVVNNWMPLPQSAVTLAEIFKQRGYRTAAFTGVKLLDRESGAGQGFDVFEHPSEAWEERAHVVVERARAWLRDVEPGEPFFLWVHLFDPHQPYAPPPRFRSHIPERLQRAARSLGWDDFMKVANANDGDIPRKLLLHAKALYRGEVESTDDQLGKLLGDLEGRDDFDRTAVVVTADHGECFEHGVYFDHAGCLYEGAIRIPLIARLPGIFEPGTRSLARVSSIDIAPTLLTAAGIEPPAGYSGRPLQHEAAPDRYVVIQHPLYTEEIAANRSRRHEVIRSVAGEPTKPIVVGVEQVGIVGEGWKYLRTGELEELYRLTPGSSDGENLAAEKVDEVRRLRSILERELERHPLVVADPHEINDALLQTLRALGYAE